jgi:hypothetical protein
MKVTGDLTFFVIATTIAAGSALGHHALGAEYDLKRSVTLTGTVTKVEWQNPHVRLYLDANGAGSSDVTHWELEMASPNLMVLNGLKIDSLRRGDVVTVSANPARDGSNLGYARKISRGAH